MMAIQLSPVSGNNRRRMVPGKGGQQEHRRDQCRKRKQWRQCKRESRVRKKDLENQLTPPVSPDGPDAAVPGPSGGCGQSRYCHHDLW